MPCAALQREVGRAVPSRLAAVQESGWQQTEGRVRAAQVEELQREEGMGNESKTTLSLILYSLEKACLFQTLLILVHVQLGRCTWRQI